MSRVSLLGAWALVAAVRVAAGQGPPPDYKKGPGPLEVTATRLDWKDERRGRDVPVKVYAPKAGAGPFPVIVFSHGLGGTRDGYEYLGRHWAGHGYVVVHVQHIGSDASVWQDVPPKDRMDAMRKSAHDLQNAVDRPLDVRFTIDQVEKLNKDDATFKNRLDLAHIGMAGHSFGAYTTLAVAGETFISAA